jgi:hypothetical protein
MQASDGIPWQDLDNDVAPRLQLPNAFDALSQPVGSAESISWFGL